MSFSDLGLTDPLVRAVEARNYTEPTPVQLEAIPVVLEGQDVWAMAETGSGKTAAFALPLIQRSLQIPRPNRQSIGVLVLVPTRELADQIEQSFAAYTQYLPTQLKIVCVYGGVSANPQMMALRGGADIVIATPGRLLDLIDQNALQIGDVQAVVLDEADKLFELGFTDELTRITDLLPEERQTLLFSATFPPAVSTLAKSLLTDPVKISFSESPTEAPAITEKAIEVDAPRRTQLLLHLLQDPTWTRVLVFVSTKYSTGHVAEKLRRADITAGSLHGQLSQGARLKAINDFKAGTLQVLVATDLAARGIDIPELPVVVNYDLPRSVVSYTHRIGRTGRAGLSGTAVSFVTADTFPHFQLIEKRHDRVIPREQIEGFEPAAVSTPVPINPDGGGIKGKRKSKKDKLREAAGQSLPPTQSPSPTPRPTAKAQPAPRPQRQSRPRQDRPERAEPERNEIESSFAWHRARPGSRRR